MNYVNNKDVKYYYNIMRCYWIISNPCITTWRQIAQFIFVLIAAFWVPFLPFTARTSFVINFMVVGRKVLWEERFKFPLKKNWLVKKNNGRVKMNLCKELGTRFVLGMIQQRRIGTRGDWERGYNSVKKKFCNHSHLGLCVKN